MKKNLESVAQRGEHIDQLQDKSENLNQSAQGFRRGANRVRKQMWWKNMKMRIWIIVGIIILLLIIIIPSGTTLFPLSQYCILTRCSCCVQEQIKVRYDRRGTLSIRRRLTRLIPAFGLRHDLSTLHLPNSTYVSVLPHTTRRKWAFGV